MPPSNPGLGTTSATTTADSNSDSEDDYMKMDFSAPAAPTATTTSQPESSIARLRRLRREAEIRGRPKSKAELAAEAESRLESAHSQSLLSQNPKSKGLAMMAKMGFAPGKTLGKSSAENAAKEPIKVSVKDGREGIGLESERKRKLREAVEANKEMTKRAKVDEGEYRERMRREREEARLERLFCGAQKVAERMGGERLGEGEESKLLLKGLPVVWRGLVKNREEGERMRRMRHDLEYGLADAARLPTYDDADEDEDDKKALGKNKAATYVASEDLDEEDEELEEFEKLPVEERLSKVVEYLRGEFNYCFWCKFAYPDKDMEGCPGLTEENHD
ncbi:hypothetical protein QBC44DRAFT_122055 [Cladorrhinum sp. PSN332]|nr:hypothetical protein QBC44DRAFT_122055 [Cladorrhinum sp. PSN332]